VDIFWVNHSPYFHTISEWVKFRTVTAINNRTQRTLHIEIQAVIKLYETRGFTVTRVEGEQEFSCLANNLLPTPLNIADADDHVAEVERSIRTIKERVRCLVQGLPFKRITKAMMRAAIENANKTHNQFPVKNGVSDNLSPLTIMTGRPTPDYNDMKIEFGAYAQVFEDNNPTKTPRARTMGAIALTPTGNAQGGYFFLSLATGRKLSGQQWDALPMPEGVVAAVERMAQNESQPLIGQGSPLFEWSPGVPIEEDAQGPILIQDGHKNEDTEIADEVVDEVADEVANEAAEEPLFGMQPVLEEHGENNLGPEIDTPGADVIIEDQRSDSGSDAGDNDEDAAEPYIEDHRGENAHDDEYDSSSLEDAKENDDIHETDPMTEAKTRYSLRPNRARNYSHRLGHIMDEPGSATSYDAQFLQQDDGEDGPTTLREAIQEMQRTGCNHVNFKHITGIIMTQMSVKAERKKHGQVAIDALFEEFSQLHDLGVFLAQYGHKLTIAEKRGALRAISVVKEKRCGRIKGRTVPDGRPQRQLYAKEETSSPTVFTDALMLSLLIGATEHRDVATADVAGAYLPAKMKDFTLLKMEGESVEIMCNVCEDYRKYVCHENGKKVLYLKLLKALYGCVQSALLWYKLFPPHYR
jgi:hypothetical protein